MKRPSTAFALIVCTLVGVPAAHAQLAEQVRAVLADKHLQKASVGIAVARLGEGETPDDARTIHDHNAGTPLIPASNLKVVTTAAALSRLGPGFEFRTRLYLHDGDLVLVGDGDPTFGDAELLRREPYAQAGWTVDTVFKQWTAREKLAARAVASVRDVVVDDGIFDEQFVHPNWPADQVHKRYVAGVAGMNLNANCIDFHLRAGRPGEVVSYAMQPRLDYVTVLNSCVSSAESAVWLSREPGSDTLILKGKSPTTGDDEPVSITVADPPIMAAHVLRQAVVDNGTPVTGVVRRDRTARARLTADPGRWTLIALHKVPLAEVLRRANKDSMNVYAESLYKRLGHEKTGVGDWAGGAAAVSDYLRGIGVAPEQFALDDGSGLSRRNRISPAAIVRVLSDQHAGPNRDAFLNSLAVAGIDGTLDDRFRGSDLRGRVYAKSGYINKVSALSGYLRAKDDRWYAFSVMFNNFTGSNAEMKQLQERVVRAIDHHAAMVAAR